MSPRFLRSGSAAGSGAGSGTGSPAASSSGAPDSERIVLRPASAPWTFGIVAAFLIWLFSDAVYRGAWEFALSALPWMLLILWAVYVVLLRPCVALGPGGITIVNVFRRHLIPWRLVDDFTTRFSLLVRLTDGTAIRSWGAPSTGIDRPFQTGSSSGRFAAAEQPRASGVRRSGGAGHARQRRPGDPTIGTIIDGARDRWDATWASRDSVLSATAPSTSSASASGAAPAGRVSRWEWWTIAVTVVLAVACALTLL